MLKPPLRILIVAALCIVGLITLVVRESMARDAGQDVLLSMEAIDPRSLLSGHYVIVTLAETLPLDQDCSATPVTELNDPPPDQWLALRPAGAIHRIAGAAPTREAALRLGPIAARGTTFCNTAMRTPGNEVMQPATYRSDLGIDRFHVSQADAQRIEAVLRDQVAGEEARVYAIVSIGQDGHARLKGLQVDGERIELNWL